VLLVLVGIIISLMVGACRRSSEFGPAFITTVEWDPVNDKYGAADRHRRHPGHFRHRAADRLPGQLRHCAVPDRDLPGLAAPPAGHGGRIAGRRTVIIYGMWGLFVFAPFCSATTYSLS
jgi:phosphate transport system permease protein